MVKNIFIARQFLITSTVLLAGCGSWFSINLAGLTLRSVDFIIFSLIVITTLSSLSGKKLLSLNFSDISETLIAIYFLLLFTLPIYGLIIDANQLAALSSSIRWIVLFIFLIIIKRYFKYQIISDFKNAFAFVIITNVCYAFLQYMELVGFIPYGILPHHFLAETTFAQSIKETAFRATGLQVGPNQLGWIGIFGVLFFFNKYIVEHKNKDLIFSLFSLCAILLSASRTALIAGIVSISFCFLINLIQFIRENKFSFPRNTLILLITMPIIILAVVILICSHPNLGYIRRAFLIFSQGASADGSFLKRVDNYWISGLDLFFERPVLGWGFDPTILVGHPIDSGWISYLAQGGVFLTFSFAILLFYTAFRSLNEFFRNSRNFIPLVVFSYSLSIFIGSFLLSPFHYLFNNIVFFMMFFFYKNSINTDNSTL